MARRLSVAELEEKAKVLRARQAARKAYKAANPTPYRKKDPTDYETVYYRDPLETGRFLKFDVKKQALTNLGGVDDAGLLTSVSTDAVVVEVNRGSKIPIVKLKWYFGDETAVVVAATDRHGRWIKKYDDRGGQSHWSLPFSIAQGTFNLNTIITKFNTYFNNTNGTKRNVLGANGYAELIIGYGNKYTTLDTSK